MLKTRKLTDKGGVENNKIAIKYLKKDFANNLENQVKEIDHKEIDTLDDALFYEVSDKISIARTRYFLSLPTSGAI